MIGGMKLEWTGATVCHPEARTPTEEEAIGPVSGWFSRSNRAIRGDTYPMTWGDDGRVYLSAGDPQWGGKFQGLDFDVLESGPPEMLIRRVNVMPDYIGNAGEGTKPTGLISVRGSLYLAVQNLLGLKPVPSATRSQHGSDAQIFRSDDHGLTWSPDRKGITAPMFPGAHFGGPAFVNVGKDHAGAADRWIYAISAEQWDNGSSLRLGRVPDDRVQDLTAWSWVAGFGTDGTPTWSSDLAASVPVLERPRGCGAPELVWIEALRSFLLLTWQLKMDFSCDDGSELFVYRSPDPWGPFTLIHHESEWETRDIGPYCPRLPLKWIRPVAGGIEGWLFFSGAWREDSRHYHLHARPFRLTAR